MPEPRPASIRLPTGTQRLRWGELYGSSPAYFLAEAARASAPARRRDGQRPRGGPVARGASLLRSAGASAYGRFRTARRCHTILSRRTRTSSPSGCGRSPRCPSWSAASSSRPWPPCSIACRRARSSRRTPSRWRPASASTCRGCATRLADAGYAQVTQVLSPGEFAVRGLGRGPVPGRVRRNRIASTCSTT